MSDLYEVLQVSPRAEPEVIRAAYRTLARKYHPDFGGDARQMVKLNEAWDVLGDPLRRAGYDAAGLAPRDRPAPQAPGPFGGGSSRYASAATAGPPPGRRSGTVLDFGRYAGWSLGELAAHDPDYLEWLERTPIGRPLRAEIETLLGASVATAAPPAPRQRGRRRR